MPSIESSYSTHISRLFTGFADPRTPSLLVAMTLLDGADSIIGVRVTYLHEFD